MKITEKAIDFRRGFPIRADVASVPNTMPHYHEHALELLYCLCGQIEVVSGHQRIRLDRGDVLSVDCEDIHSLRSTGGTGGGIVARVHIDLRNAEHDFEKLRYVFFDFDSSRLYAYREAHMERLKNQILALSLDAARGTQMKQRMARAVSEDMLANLLEHFNWVYSRHASAELTDSFKSRYMQLLAYCQKHYGERISLARLAEKMNISPNYLSQFMHNTSFENFTNMLNYIRCFRVERLLLTTDMPVIEISEACGFSDPKYMYSSFRYWWGCTPKGLRNTYREYLAFAGDERSVPADEAVDMLESEIVKRAVAVAFSCRENVQ